MSTIGVIYIKCGYFHPVRIQDGNHPVKSGNLHYPIHAVFFHQLGHVSCKDRQMLDLEELDIVKNYLRIQSKRFGDRIKIKYDIEETDFDIPPFSIQTLVENAVHHGFKSGQIDQGLIRVSTKKSGDQRVVIVEDNGVGFDIGKLDNKNKSSVGIVNTKNRVEIMCKGELIIESEPGKGTRAIITIPE